jgi:hypothetical protein
MTETESSAPAEKIISQAEPELKSILVDPNEVICQNLLNFTMETIMMMP